MKVKRNCTPSGWLSIKRFNLDTALTKEFEAPHFSCYENTAGVVNKYHDDIAFPCLDFKKAEGAWKMDTFVLGK